MRLPSGSLLEDGVEIEEEVEVGIVEEKFEVEKEVEELDEEFSQVKMEFRKGSF